MERSIWNIRIKHGFDSCFVPAERRTKYEQDEPIDSGGENPMPDFRKIISRLTITLERSKR
jgi:hypothetical protein